MPTPTAAATPAPATGNIKKAPGHKKSSAPWIEHKIIPGKHGKKYGPYRYLRWRENGRTRSKYLGKVQVDD